MSKRTIQIEIDAEDETCGRCIHAIYDMMINGFGCTAYHFTLVGTQESERSPELIYRCEACKAAEVKKP